jgi:hypothetical protein
MGAAVAAGVAVAASCHMGDNGGGGGVGRLADRFQVRAAALD